MPSSVFACIYNFINQNQITKKNNNNNHQIILPSECNTLTSYQQYVSDPGPLLYCQYLVLSPFFSLPFLYQSCVLIFPLQFEFPFCRCLVIFNFVHALICYLHFLFTEMSLHVISHFLIGFISVYRV